MAKAIAYVRYSSATQGDGDSVERQTAPLRDFEEKFNTEITEIIKDEGVSSFRGDNIKTGKFKGIIKKIEIGEIIDGDYLVIESIDRISRQELNKTASILQGILDKGISIYTTSDQRLYSVKDKSRDLEDYMMIGLIAKRANEESETKSKRRKSAWNKAKRDAENGKFFHTANSIPYGFMIENNQITIHEERAKEIKFIFENLKKEGVSATVRKLNEWSERKWTPRHIHLMTVNKYPIGSYMSQKRVNGKKVFEKYIENYYPKIIDEKTFSDAINAMKTRGLRKEYGNQSKGFLNIFRHCIKCDDCGETMMFMIVQNQKKSKFCYLSCRSKKEKKTGCKEQTVRFEYVLALFLEKIRTIFEIKNSIEFDELDSDVKEELFSIEEKGLMGLITETENKEKEIQAREKEIQLEKSRSVLENIEKSLDGLNGIYPKSLIKRLQDTESDIEKLETEVKELSSRKRDTLNLLDFQDFINLLYKEDGRRRINEVLKSNEVIFKIEYNRENKEVVLKSNRDTYDDDAEYGCFIAKSRSFDILNEFNLRNMSQHI